MKVCSVGVQFVHVDPLFACSSVEQIFVTVETVRSVTVCVETWWWFLVRLIIRVAVTHPCVTISPSFWRATLLERNIVVCHLWTLDDKKMEEIRYRFFEGWYGPLKDRLVETNIPNDCTFLNFGRTATKNDLCPWKMKFVLGKWTLSLMFLESWWSWCSYYRKLGELSCIRLEASSTFATLFHSIWLSQNLAHLWQSQPYGIILLWNIGGKLILNWF